MNLHCIKTTDGPAKLQWPKSWAEVVAKMVLPACSSEPRKIILRLIRKPTSNDRGDSLHLICSLTVKRIGA